MKICSKCNNEMIDLMKQLMGEGGASKESIEREVGYYICPDCGKEFCGYCVGTYRFYYGWTEEKFYCLDCLKNHPPKALVEIDK